MEMNIDAQSKLAIGTFWEKRLESEIYFWTDFPIYSLFYFDYHQINFTKKAISKKNVYFEDFSLKILYFLTLLYQCLYVRVAEVGGHFYPQSMFLHRDTLKAGNSLQR